MLPKNELYYQILLMLLKIFKGNGGGRANLPILKLYVKKRYEFLENPTPFLGLSYSDTPIFFRSFISSKNRVIK